MKKLILIAAAMMVAAAAYGQGQFNFVNRDTATGINARFVLPGDAANTSSVGTDYTVTLEGAPTGTTTFVPLTGGPVTIRGAAGSATAGYVSLATMTVPNVAAGASADIRITISGPGGSTQLTRTVGPLGGGTVLPPLINLGSQPIVVPEPSTLALGALGLGALLALRRRKA